MLKRAQAPINTCLLLLSLVMACIEEMEELILPELEELCGTTWHLLHFDQLVIGIRLSDDVLWKS